MTDRPILFSAPMVRALLAGTKTQTRRILTPDWVRLWDGRRERRPDAATLEGALKGAMDFRLIDGIWTWKADPLPHQESAVFTSWQGRLKVSPGDRLWVREAHYLTDDGLSEWAVYIADGNDATGEHLDEVAALEKLHPDVDWSDHKRQRPSIHMPRWASRLTLVVTGVRIERLQDISEADAIAEGIERHKSGWLPYSTAFYEADGTTPANYHPDPRESYRSLWNKINGFGSYDANPWIVAVTFTVVRQNIDQVAP